MTNHHEVQWNSQPRAVILFQCYVKIKSDTFIQFLANKIYKFETHLNVKTNMVSTRKMKQNTGFFSQQLDESLNGFVIGRNIQLGQAENETVETHNDDFFQILRSYNDC